MKEIKSKYKKESVFYFTHARTSLKYGLISLDFKINDSILIPDYICDVVTDILKALKLNIIFYGTDDSFQPDWNYLFSLNDIKIKGILMVHYFGFPQNINKFQELSKKKSWFLIEDNAHGHGGYYNNELLGTFGDIGISSPRKSLRLNSGGILYINKKIELKINNNIESSRYSILTYILYFLNRNNLIKQILKKLFTSRVKYEIIEQSREKIDDCFIDKFSRNKIETDLDKINSLKRKNFRSWSQFSEINKLNPIFKNINDDISPLCFPVLVKNKKEAIFWFKWGWSNYYDIYSWPNLPFELIKHKKLVSRFERLVCFSTHSRCRHLKNKVVTP